MTMNIPDVTQKLAALGVSDPAQVASLFAELRAEFDRNAAAVDGEASWKAFRDRWLGRKTGMLTRITDNWLKPAPAELKRTVGAALNELRAHVEREVEERRRAVQAAEEQAATSRAGVDLSLPGVPQAIGAKHLLQQTIEEIERIFLSLGYSVADGPEVETPYYNFEALNIPENHPARDTMDTLYLAASAGEGSAALPAGGLLLRTHTSPVQVRVMERQKPPVRIIVPGKVYRHDNPDATHSYMFTQVEGLAVDTDITFCDFRGTMEYLLREFFGPRVKTRLQPSYFPFTEPSADVFGSCFVCAGSGCRICKFSGWIELLGAGMVDPTVYGFVNYDAKKLSGFAFGIGVERFAILKYGISDIQMFFQNDVRFLRQFR